MNLFNNFGIGAIPHFSPLHYLPFIARSQALLSKERLLEAGYVSNHFRSKSKRTDMRRGFGEYAFLTLSENPRIVQAKLKGGFPHIAVQVPVSEFDAVNFDLCRYNVAMVRRTLDSPTGGFPESSTNGRYYGNKKLPIAREPEDKITMLNTHYPKGTMIEVLVRDNLNLPDDTTIHCYSADDTELARRIIDHFDLAWNVIDIDPPGDYQRHVGYAECVEEFINMALEDETWRGSGLEFDRV